MDLEDRIMVMLASVSPTFQHAHLTVMDEVSDPTVEAKAKKLKLIDEFTPNHRLRTFRAETREDSSAGREMRIIARITVDEHDNIVHETYARTVS